MQKVTSHSPEWLDRGKCCKRQFAATGLDLGRSCELAFAAIFRASTILGAFPRNCCKPQYAAKRVTGPGMDTKV